MPRTNFYTLGRGERNGSQDNRSSSDPTLFIRKEVTSYPDAGSVGRHHQVDPISVLAFGNRFLITDGHHRTYQALLAGRDTISAEFDRDGGDELYDLYAQACEERKITSVLDLKHRILPQDEYEAKWYNWCDGFNQAATLLLKRQADEIDKANRLAVPGHL